MEELIFFAVIIFFSILESIARSRKAKKGGGADGPLPDPVEWEVQLPDLEPGRTSRQGGSDLETYDDDPSYDDILEEQRVEERRSRDGESLERYSRPRSSGRPARPSPSRSRPSSETHAPR